MIFTKKFNVKIFSFREKIRIFSKIKKKLILLLIKHTSSLDCGNSWNFSLKIITLILINTTIRNKRKWHKILNIEVTF